MLIALVLAYNLHMIKVYDREVRCRDTTLPRVVSVEPIKVTLMNAQLVRIIKAARRGNRSRRLVPRVLLNVHNTLLRAGVVVN